MRLLLDTHVFLWVITDDSRLSSSFNETIRNIDNEVYLSVASVWEMIIKFQLGKLPLPESPQTYIRKQRELHQISSLPLIESDLKHLPDLPRIHRDPFDRILVCQAFGNQMTIVTADPIIKEYGVNCL